MDFNFDERFEHVWADEYVPTQNEQGSKLYFMTISGKQYTFTLDWNTKRNMPLLSYSTTDGASFQHFLIDGLTSSSPTLMEVCTMIGFDNCKFELSNDGVEGMSLEDVLNSPVRGLFSDMYLYEFEHGTYMPM